MVNILKKLHAIMTDVDFIEKDKFNSFHKYQYASEYAIKTRLHDALVKHGVVFYISHAEMKVTDVVTPKGNSERLTSAVLTYRFYDVESGESIEGQGIGQGQDPGDKGAYKAITGALKYILTTSFVVPTGDDPEADEALDKRTSGAEKQSTKQPSAQPSAQPATVPPGGNTHDETKALHGRIGVQRKRPGVANMDEGAWVELLKRCFDAESKNAIMALTPMQLKIGIDKLAATIDEMEGK